MKTMPRDTMETVLLEVKPHGYYPADEGGDIYSDAVREWVALQLRKRGHEQYHRGKVRNCTFDYDEPWGSEVTPPSPKVVSIVCEIRKSDKKVGWWTDDEGWSRHEEAIHFISPSQLVIECAYIADKLAWLARMGATDAMVRDD